MTLTYKVTRDSWYVELYIFEIPDPKNLQNKKKIITLASLEHEIQKVTLMVTWPWRARSRVIAGMWNYIFLRSLTLKICKTKKYHRSCVIRTRDTKGHAHGHVTLTYKVMRDSWYVELYIFDIPDPKNLQNKKKIIALASLEQKIRKVTFRVTRPWRTGSRFEFTVLWCINLRFTTQKNKQNKKKFIALAFLHPDIL